MDRRHGDVYVYIFSSTSRKTFRPEAIPFRSLTLLKRVSRIFLFLQADYIMQENSIEGIIFLDCQSK
ncbi:hypothetical protein KGF41_20445 [Clostridioides sp. ZZV14-6150]|nr:hypothetical protein [Clostridioides sp. ZZV14-6150]